MAGLAEAPKSDEFLTNGPFLASSAGGLSH